MSKSISQRRRSRWTYAFADGIEEPHCILSYSEENVRSYFERRNKSLAYVIKGDHREVAYARQAKIQAQKEAIKAQGGGFVWDQEAIEAAKLQLGVTWPVRIYLNGKVGGTDGKHRPDPDHRGHRGHRIMVKRYLTAERASHVLWHELTHARQMEEAGSWEAWAKITRTQKLYHYKCRPIELEADSVALKNSNKLLTRSARVGHA